jgi:excisionase family DNA binding protein
MELLSITQVMEMLGVSRSTVERMVRQGRLPRPIKLGPAQGSSIRFEKAKVEAALAAMQTGVK